MSGEEEKTYEVGYKKPPIATRFQKGQSGNASGRPKKVPALLDPGIMLEYIDNEEISVMARVDADGCRKLKSSFGSCLQRPSRET